MVKSDHKYDYLKKLFSFYQAKNVVFAILIAENQLVTLTRMKKYFIHPADLHLIFSLINSTESFKVSEAWIPICLPKFDSRYVMAYAIRSECRGVVQKGMVPICENCHMPYAMMARKGGS